MVGFEVTLYGRFWVTPEVVRQLHEVSPKIRMLFLCDKNCPNMENLAQLGHVRKFLKKPFRRAKFLGEVLEMMDHAKTLTA